MAHYKSRARSKSAGACPVISSLIRSRLSFAIIIATLVVLVIIATASIYHESPQHIFNIKTVAGDNLRPTPWHHFDLSGPKGWRQYAARLPKVVKCNYLSCLTHSPMHSEVHARLPTNPHTCPDYFQWIYEDLAPWTKTRITVESLQEAQKHAAFRIIIVAGRLYAEFYYACARPRAMFTVWGILQLLDKYPGMVPDVDLMFDCMDKPAVMKIDYSDKRPPPPLFRYCSHSKAFDIAFPDWSFWGWPETNLLPWAEELESIYAASKNTEWENRDPTAFWKGNPDVGSEVRVNLLKCNVTEDKDWGARIFRQDWWTESMGAYKNSKISEQCKYRFKIYTEGHAWSVSFKYIFACDSPVLVASPTYHEFFTRGLIPMVHYRPVWRDDLCHSIKLAVEWGNKHPDEAKNMGTAGQEFMHTNLTMDHVYDYMFHLLSEYAKLQSFRPVAPPEAPVLCKNAVLCLTDDPKTNYTLLTSEVKASQVGPCSMAPRDRSYILSIKRKRHMDGWEGEEDTVES